MITFHKKLEMHSSVRHQLNRKSLRGRLSMHPGHLSDDDQSQEQAPVTRIKSEINTTATPQGEMMLTGPNGTPVGLQWCSLEPFSNHSISKLLKSFERQRGVYNRGGRGGGGRRLDELPPTFLNLKQTYPSDSRFRLSHLLSKTLRQLPPLEARLCSRYWSDLSVLSKSRSRHRVPNGPFRAISLYMD